MLEAGINRDLKIFATDIDRDAVMFAATGVYPKSIAADIPPELLAKYFYRKQDSYQISRSVREMVVFAQHNLIKDPPFTNIDLISCRNLLIYLGPELQKRLLPIFHYSLKPGAILFLGSSETIGQNSDYFKVLDKKWKLFNTLPATTSHRTLLSFPGVPVSKGEMEVVLPDNIKKLEEISAFQLVEAILQQSDAPPCAIINADHNIVYIHGRTGQFLEPAEGRGSVNILEMARSGLKKELSEAIHKVSLHKHDVLCKSLQVAYDGGFISVDMSVKLLLEPVAMRGMMMVVFDEAIGREGDQSQVKRPRTMKKRRTVEELEHELLYSKENLQATIEELQSSNEELKSTNEELQATNEELQSTNEEMETSKEELQSLNEESVTVNAELQSRIDELSQANDDLKNLIDSTGIATIFLDIDLCVRRFAPCVTALIPLAASDVGRPIKHFASSLIDVDLTADADKVLSDLAVIDREVTARGGNVYRMLIRPYRTVNNVIDGVVLTFDDITLNKRAARQLIREKKFAENIVSTIRQPLLVLDRHLRVVTANPAFYARFQAKAKETVGEFIFALGNRQWDIRELRKLLEEILIDKTTIEEYSLEFTFDSLGKRTLTLNARKMRVVAGEEELILLAIEDSAQQQGDHDLA